MLYAHTGGAHSSTVSFGGSVGCGKRCWISTGAHDGRTGGPKEHCKGGSRCFLCWPAGPKTLPRNSQCYSLQFTAVLPAERIDTAAAGVRGRESEWGGGTWLSPHNGLSGNAVFVAIFPLYIYRHGKRPLAVATPALPRTLALSVGPHAATDNALYAMSNFYGLLMRHTSPRGRVKRRRAI